MAKEHKSHRKPSPKPLHHKPELLSGLWPSAGRDHQGLALLQVGNDDCRTIATQFLSYTLHIILHMYVRMYVMLYVKCYSIDVCMYVCIYIMYVAFASAGRFGRHTRGHRITPTPQARSAKRTAAERLLPCSSSPGLWRRCPPLAATPSTSSGGNWV